jgi:hypothetical protein
MCFIFIFGGVGWNQLLGNYWPIVPGLMQMSVEQSVECLAGKPKC